MTSSQEIRFYVHRGEKYLAKDRATWSDFLSYAWSTTDRVEAGTVAREFDGKALPIKGAAL